MYDTAGRTDIDSAYGCDIYENALEKLSLKKHLTKILSSIYVVHKQDTFFMLCNSNKDTAETLLLLMTHV